ncbi:45 kDa calcium-binding protein-like [Ctenocephalides felis]|nr:45 kDa calcium-binding protein-like [Ctenocephalides felis]
MWSEAARNDPYSLTLDEFLAFKHPESSAANMLGIVDDLLEKFDRDGDDVLTEDEFSTFPDYDFTPLFGDETTVKKQSKQEESNRRKEFVHLVDKNRDGKADRQELLKYVDPRHPRHSLQEAATLMSLADANNDNNLSLSEILKKMELFLGSKMVGTAKSFHEDF